MPAGTPALETSLLSEWHCGETLPKGKDVPKRPHALAFRIDSLVVARLRPIAKLAEPTTRLFDAAVRLFDAAAWLYAAAITPVSPYVRT